MACPQKVASCQQGVREVCAWVKPQSGNACFWGSSDAPKTQNLAARMIPSRISSRQFWGYLGGQIVRCINESRSAG
eukprot:8269450-Pyramimonas_sp.AAC.1